MGTRPNFIKVTQFKKVAEEFDDIQIEIIHTGQHYDERMARVFFDQFGLRPDVFLDISRGKPFEQIAETISKLGRHFAESSPDFVLVVGDVNSTLAGAIAANKVGIPIGHLESGLRSFDSSMPEEHNRKVADHLAQLHFVTEDSGLLNLDHEGINHSGVCFTGNTMIDTLVAYRDQIQSSKIVEKEGLKDEGYALVTIHRPGNVDSPESLELVADILEETAAKLLVVFPVHPRTLNKMKEFGLADRFEKTPGLKLISPQGYFDFQRLIASSKFVLTDSGGIQEETTYLNKPCLTLRPNTERPVTIELGSNMLLPFDPSQIQDQIDQILSGKFKRSETPRFWDGKATERVLERISSYFELGS